MRTLCLAAAPLTLISPTTSDPGYNASTGSYTITLGIALPTLTNNVQIVGPGD